MSGARGVVVSAKKEVESLGKREEWDNEGERK